MCVGAWIGIFFSLVLVAAVDIRGDGGSFQEYFFYGSYGGGINVAMCNGVSIPLLHLNLWRLLAVVESL